MPFQTYLLVFRSTLFEMASYRIRPAIPTAPVFQVMTGNNPHSLIFDYIVKPACYSGFSRMYFLLRRLEHVKWNSAVTAQDTG